MRDALRWTVIGGLFLLPFIPLVVTGSLFFSYITGKNFAFRIIVEIIFAAWALLALYDKAYRPRFSWILASLAGFVSVIFIADLFGENPARSFWSNFERMEGWVTLVHLLLYFLVASSMLTSEKWWRWFFNTSLIAAGFVSLYAFAQLSGMVGIAQGGVRIDATLGNAIYMAVYMLFHAFIAFSLLIESKATWMRVLYGALALVFTSLLILTGTRGTILGLAVGLLGAALYAVLFSTGNPAVRKAAMFCGAGVLIVSGVFYAARHTALVQESPILVRVASVFSLKEALGTRMTIWGMALAGSQERPVLGWGQSNFDYVFDRHYQPSLYAQEPWFDRVHNTVLDWLIAGGFVGLAAYLAVWAAMLYALCTPWRVSDDRRQWSVAERAIVVGLLVGYGIHNIVVFDNLVSYFFFATILAFVHTRTGRKIQRLSAFHFDGKVVTQIAAPVVGVLLCLTVYYVNIPHLRAAGDIIDALQYMDAAARYQGGILPDGYNTVLMRGLDEFKRALGRNSFADQEVREQLAIVAQRVYLDEKASENTKRAYIQLAEAELLTQAQEHPDTARTHSFLVAFYRTVGDTDRALEQLAILETLTPNKQAVLFDLGFTHISRGEYEAAKEAFRRAFVLAPEYADARAHYIVGALYSDDDALVAELSAPPYDALYRNHDVILQTYYALKEYTIVLSLLDARIAQMPSNVELRVTKAAVLHESGDTPAAIEALKQIIKDFPEFKTQGEKFLEELLTTL